MMDPHAPPLYGSLPPEGADPAWGGPAPDRAAPTLRLFGWLAPALGRLRASSPMPCGRAEQRSGVGIRNSNVRRPRSGQVCEFPPRREQRKVPRRGLDFGSPFFALRFFGEAKKRRSAAGPRPGQTKPPETAPPVRRCIAQLAEHPGFHETVLETFRSLTSPLRLQRASLRTGLADVRAPGRLEAT
ncbi:MAG: hypothetical protein C0453_07315 [Comamonadaceae bacterium]|nr:hypothetical protein [Comamonadaceae bacterium]